MTKKVTQLNSAGKPITYTVTRAMKKSTAREIQPTAAPKTAWERFKRNAVG